MCKLSFALSVCLAFVAFLTPGVRSQWSTPALPSGPVTRQPVDPVGGFLDSVEDELRDTSWYADRMLGMADELLRLATDDGSATRLLAANTTTHDEVFGEVYVHEASGILSTAGALPQLQSLNGTVGALDGLQVWPIDVDSLFLDPPFPQGGAAAAIYTGRVDDGPETIGFLCEFDFDALGLFGCSGTPGCSFVVVVPYDVITPGGPVTATQAGEYFARALDGSFDTPGVFRAWLESHVGSSVALSVASGGGGALCDQVALAQCLADVDAKFQSDMGAIRDGVGQKIDDLEQDLVDAGKGALAQAAQGAVAGGITGAVVGAGGGPLAAGAGAAIGAVAGAVGGLVAWAIGTDVDAIVEELQQARASAQGAKCAALSAARDGAEACAEEHCPEAREQLVNYMTLLLVQNDCCSISC